MRFLLLAICLSSFSRAKWVLAYEKAHREAV